jgi:hypothetical protein
VSASAAVTSDTNPIRCAASRSNATPACQTTPSPSALTFTRRGKPVELITEKVLLVLAGTDLRQIPSSQVRSTFPVYDTALPRIGVKDRG